MTPRTDFIDADRVHALAGLLNLPTGEADTLGPGSILRPMWHLAFLLPRPAQADLGPDGHPLVGEVEPPASGLRRMFAGGLVRLNPGLRVGAEAVATSIAGPARERVGRSGTMHFVTLTTEVRQEDSVVMTEERNLVYLGSRPAAGGAGKAAGTSDPRPDVTTEVGPAVREVEVDETLLFRFSALTYNAHRIHYDRDYARDVEGYDGLVVHGPLQALLMAEAAREALTATGGGSDDLEFSYRLVSQLGERDGLLVHRGEVTDDGVVVAVADRTGRITARGHLHRGTGEGTGTGA